MQKARRVKISKKEGTEGEKEGKGLEPFLAALFFSVKKKKHKKKKEPWQHNSKAASLEIVHSNV